jgi:hypothetical protein
MLILSHISEHASTQFGLVGARVCPSWGFNLTPFSQLRLDPSIHLISNMGGLGQRHVVHMS